MRTLFLAMAILFAGCNDDNDMKLPDLSVNVDMRVPRDLSGTSSCDPVTQDCSSGKKCTYVLEDPQDPMTPIVATCVDVTGNKGFEETCTRGADGNPGDDNCGAGFFCSVIGWGGTLTNPDRHCNQLCRTTADCPAEHHCIPRTDFSGDCVRDCGSLTSTGCGGSLVCSFLLQDIDSTQNSPDFFLTCRNAGSGGVGDVCMDDTECKANLLCDTQDGVCIEGLCDGTRMCPAGDMGLMCTTLNDVGELGFCQ